ncbi:flagellar hook-length control protein FliK [Dechloromonas sp. ZY10]|uniref:flagellar hook-length control protein FliK n=1 Tax=Dechloromonas aquae TaxID=2664436 RepID=UPI003526F1AD
MLPDLLTPRLRPGLDTSIPATTPVKNIADALADFSPGQKIMAEIQAMLPNGAYRALVGQRELTLALPFSAKAGDTLELEVQENDGQLVLAVIRDKGTGDGQATPRHDSASTTLSSTGRLIGDLLGEVTRDSKRPPPITLNGNQPLITAGPIDAEALAASLKQALGQSGMFYEAHQAKWVHGTLPEAHLRQEPQGKLPPQASNAEEAFAPPPASGKDNLPPPASAASPPVFAGGEIHRDAVPLVQHQLDALATQQFVWQGQAWPGQPMHWEIAEEENPNRNQDNDDSNRWRTRLQLKLPQLGGIDATLQLLPGGEIRIRMRADSEQGEQALREASGKLQQQYEDAGLTLSQLQIDHELPETLPVT